MNYKELGRKQLPCHKRALPYADLSTIWLMTADIDSELGHILGKTLIERMSHDDHPAGCGLPIVTVGTFTPIRTLTTRGHPTQGNFHRANDPQT